MCCRNHCRCGCGCSGSGCGCGSGSGCGCGCGAGSNGGCGCGNGTGNNSGNGSGSGLTPVCGWEFICHHPMPLPLLRSETAQMSERTFLAEERGCGCG